jgi:hypothetical protein
MYVGRGLLRERFYNTISQENLVGTVRCAPSPDSRYDFYLFYFPNQKNADFVFLKCRGADWAFEGEIIKWKKPLNFIGIKTGQKPLRIYDSYGNSYYFPHADRGLMRKIANMIPAVDTSFISAIRQEYISKVKFGIYITNSGYLVRRIR